jgi:hypothetical protein
VGNHRLSEYCFLENKQTNNMYIYKKEELAKHQMFMQAVTLSELMTKSAFRSLYRDKSGELAVSFYGRLSEDSIKGILMHFKDLIDGDTNLSEISCVYGVDYMYSNTHHSNGEKEFTQIFTPDGYDYSSF